MLRFMTEITVDHAYRLYNQLHNACSSDSTKDNCKISAVYWAGRLSLNSVLFNKMIIKSQIARKKKCIITFILRYKKGGGKNINNITNDIQKYILSQWHGQIEFITKDI